MRSLRSQARLVEILLSVLVIMIVLLFSQNLSASLYTSNKFNESLDTTANNILFKLTALPTFNTILEQLFSAQKESAKASIKEALMILLPSGMYAQLTIVQYKCVNICQQTSSENIIIGTPQPTSNKGSSMMLFTPIGDTNTYYVITLTIWRVT